MSDIGYEPAHHRLPSSVGEPKNISTAFSLWLDFFRWTAAFAVVLNHVNNRFFVKILTLPPEMRAIEHFAWALISGFGRPAVLIFFVVSGYLVGGGALFKYLSTNTFDLREYFAARLSRLWVVLIPSMGLAYLLDSAGANLFGGIANGVYGAGGDATTVHGPLTFLCNMTFLQTALCYQYGTNGALWSLFNEFWYYVTWPLVMVAAFSTRRTSKCIGLLSAALVLLTLLSLMQFVGLNLLVYFSIWLLGVAAAIRRKPLLPVRPSAAALLFVGYLIAWRVFLPTTVADSIPILQFSSDFLTALLFANLLIAMKLEQSLPQPPFGSLHTQLAGFSFSTYCIHTPIINCYGAFLVWATGTGWGMLPRGPVPYLYAISAIALCIILSRVFAHFTERHTPRVRRYFSVKFHSSKAYHDASCGPENRAQIPQGSDA